MIKIIEFAIRAVTGHPRARRIAWSRVRWPPLVLYALPAILGGLVPGARVATARPDANARISEFRIVSNGDVPAIVIRAFGERLRFVVDSSAPTTVVDARWRQRLGRRLGSVQAPLADGTEAELEVVEGPSLELGTYQTKPESVIVADLASLGPSPVRDVAGHLGLDVLSQFVVTIDSADGLLQLRRAVPDDAGIAFPLVDSDVPSRLAVSLAIGNAGPTRFMLSTNSTVGLTVPPPSFASLHSAGAIRAADPTISSFDIKTRQVNGIVNRTTLGRFICEDVAITTFGARTVGMAYLSRYTVTIDFPRKQIYFKKSRNFSRRDGFNRSGIRVRLAGDRVVVDNVWPNSAAAAAGVLEEDVIADIAGRPADDLSMGEIEKLLWDGDDIRLGIIRAGRKRQFRVGPAASQRPAVQPSSGPAVAEAGSSTTQIAEFDIDRGGSPVVVRVSVSGLDNTLPMLLDTGAFRTAFDSRLRQHLGDEIRATRVGTPFGAQTLRQVRIGNVTLGPIALVGESIAMLSDLNAIREEVGCDLAGVLGVDLLKHQILQLDFDAGKCRILSQVASDLGERVDFLYRQTGPPAVNARIGNRAGDWFILDTGFAAAGCACNPDLFAELKSSGDVRLAGAFRSPQDAEWDGLFGTARRLELGPFSHRNISLVAANCNTLGLQYLSRYVVTFDFPGQAMYLKKGKSYTRSDREDRSGLNLVWRDGTVVVESVLPGSPAAEAGARAGDVISRVNGKDRSQISLHQMRELLKGDGLVELSLGRDGRAVHSRMLLRQHLADTVTEPPVRKRK